MDGGDYSNTGQKGFLALLCLLGLAITISAFYGLNLRHFGENTFECAALILGVIGYSGLLIFGVRGKPFGLLFFSLLFAIGKMICVGLNRGFAVPFAGTFEGFDLQGSSRYWYFTISDYFTSNFEWAIVILLFYVAIQIQEVSMPTLEQTLNTIGKSDLLSSVKFSWTTALEPVTVPQSQVVATPKLLLIIPISTALGSTKNLDESKITEISKVEYRNVHNIRWEERTGYPEEFLEVTFHLRDKRQYRRYFYLGETEEIINQNLLEKHQQISGLGKNIKLVELKEKKTESGRKLIGVGGVFISEVSDFDSGD